MKPEMGPLQGRVGWGHCEGEWNANVEARIAPIIQVIFPDTIELSLCGAPEHRESRKGVKVLRPDFRQPYGNRGRRSRFAHQDLQ